MVLTIMTQLWENRFLRVFVLVIFAFVMFSGGFVSPVKSVANGETKTQMHNTEWRLINSVVDQENIMNFTVSQVKNKKFILEREEASEWKNVYEKQFNTEDVNIQQISAKVKAPSKAGSIYYRIKIDDNEMIRFVVENHDPNNFTDYEKKAYGFVEEYCGNVYITTGDDKEMQKDKVLGLASTSENKIMLRPGMTDDDLEWVVRHECGHILQHNAYDQNRAAYPIDQKRSILWLNEELSPYYDAEFENERGTGFSEKNADCIALYLAPDKIGNSYCNGIKGQAAYNIVHEKTAVSVVEHSSFQNRLNIANTGYAVQNAKCINDTCVQEFENGTAVSEKENGKTEISFDVSENVLFKQNQESYIMPDDQDFFEEKTNETSFYRTTDKDSLHDSLN